MVHIDRESPIPLMEQILSQLAGLIQDGQLPPGTRLPSIRKLASTVSVSTATVVGAYDRLTARGLIESRAASGYFVAAQRQAPPRLARAAPKNEYDAVGLMRSFMRRGEGVTPVGSGFLPEHWLEDMLNSKLLARIARKGKRYYAQPGAPQGYPPLREQLALKLGLMGIPAAPDHVLTTFGVTHGLDLVCRTLLTAGDTVAVEEPAYFGLYAQLRAHGIKLVGVPRRAHGPDLDVLDQVCTTHRPRLFFTQTLLHNPTGGSMDAATAFHVLELSRKHGFMIIEDDVCGDLHGTANPLRLAQADRLEQVIYLASFSKVMSPAIRVGYIAAAPHLIDLFLEEKILSVLTGSEFDERLVYELLSDGSYRKHLERVRARLSHHHANAVHGLRDAGLDIASATEGGMFIWAALPEEVDMQVLIEDAARNGFLLTPGDAFFLQQSPRPMLRFSAAAANDQKLFDYFRLRLPLLKAGKGLRQSAVAADDVGG